MAQQKQIQLVSMRMWVRSLILLSGSATWPSCCELWLCLWPAAVAPIRSLAWEPPYDARAALEKKEKKKEKKMIPA